MIKMYINNEEVVSNKEFTISEEMLATPSTVLNNCYPALWENTKDYVSKFYFPKDYSKCIIGDGEFEKGSQRNIIKKVSGINPSFETNITKPWESLTIDGKSTQETRSGKNLFNTIFVQGARSNANGKDTIYSNNYIRTQNKIEVEPNTIYNIKTVSSKAFSGGDIHYYDKDGNFIKREAIGINITKTTPDNCYYINFQYYLNTGLTPSDVYNTQVEKGSTATDYEPYGVMPSPDYPSEIENEKGRNLLDNKNPNYIYGATWQPTETGGKFSSSTTWRWIGWNLKLNMNKQYTFSYGTRNSKNIYLYIRTYTDSTYTTIKTKIVNDGANLQYTFKPDSEYVRIAFANNAVIENIEIPNIQLEKGSITIRYVPYGNIQIVETGKNLLNIEDYTKSSDTSILSINNREIKFTTPNNARYEQVIYFRNITLKKNKTYTITRTKSNEMPNEMGQLELYKDATWIKIILSSGKNSNTFTVDEDYVYRIRIKLASPNQASYTGAISDIMVSEVGGNYEPYTEEVVNIDLKGNELCSLPNGTKDELIVKDGRAKIIKRIGKVVLDGLIWKRNTGTGDIIYWITTGINNIKYVSNNTELGLGYAEKYKMHIGKGMSGQEALNTIAIDVSQVTVNSYESPTGIFYYELREPYEIDLGEVTLPNTLIGQNNVTLDATLETNMEISYYYSSYDLLFAGVVKKTGNISLNPRYPHYADIQVLDFKTFLSEGETLNFVIDNKTIGQAIDMVIDAIKSYGFVKGNIMLDDINEVIGAYSTDKKTAYDVFQYFSDITNSRWFTRMIDEDTVAIDFYDTDKLPVKPKIEYTEDWFCNNLIDDMSYSIKTDDYRNKQILLSDEVFGSTPYNDLLTSNGYDTSYTTTGKIASLTSAKIDGKNATFTTEANKEGGVEADIYYKPGEVGITTNNQIGAGKVIEITYIPLVEGREIIINDEEVNRIGSQLNRNGVISRYENRNDTTSSDELRQIGQTYIKYKGKAEVTLKITSRKNIYDIGDKVQFDAPLEDLSTEYMVKKKTTKYIVTANQLFYDYELSSSFNSESEINYFDNQRSKHKGNLSEGDYITRDIDITNSANIIWHDTSIDEISITGNNILDCALDSPFTD